MNTLLIKRGFTDAKRAGDATYFKSKPCMLCNGQMYYVRGHRCCNCNPAPPAERRKGKNDPAKHDNYKKSGDSIAGRYIPEKKKEWPMMAFEDAQTTDNIGLYRQSYHNAIRCGSSAADVAEG
jgi:hypothetical protein